MLPGYIAVTMITPWSMSVDPWIATAPDPAATTEVMPKSVAVARMTEYAAEEVTGWTVAVGVAGAGKYGIAPWKPHEKFSTSPGTN